MCFVFLYSICLCSAQFSMFHVERRSRNTLIIIIIIIIIIITVIIIYYGYPRPWPLRWNKGLLSPRKLRILMCTVRGYCTYLLSHTVRSTSHERRAVARVSLALTPTFTLTHTLTLRYFGAVVNVQKCLTQERL